MAKLICLSAIASLRALLMLSDPVPTCHIYTTDALVSTTTLTQQNTSRSWSGRFQIGTLPTGGNNLGCKAYRIRGAPRVPGHPQLNSTIQYIVRDGLFLMISFIPHYTYHSVILFYKPSLFLRTAPAGPLPTCLSPILP